jgi:hypothetical protein
MKNPNVWTNMKNSNWPLYWYFRITLYAQENMSHLFQQSPPCANIRLFEDKQVLDLQLELIGLGMPPPFLSSTKRHLSSPSNA